MLRSAASGFAPQRTLVRLGTNVSTTWPCSSSRRRPRCYASPSALSTTLPAGSGTPIYEAEFLGFSYGFRPGRGQHDAYIRLLLAAAPSRQTADSDGCQKIPSGPNGIKRIPAESPANDVPSLACCNWRIPKGDRLLNDAV